MGVVVCVVVVVVVVASSVVVAAVVFIVVVVVVVVVAVVVLIIIVQILIAVAIGTESQIYFLDSVFCFFSACDAGSWGRNCVNRCSSTCRENTCMKHNGYCSSKYNLSQQINRL